MHAPGSSVVSLFAPREKIYTREVHGRHTTWRWASVWLTQLVYYGLPWLAWNGRPAVLFDLAARKFFLFGLVLWPQDLIYLAAALILCACLLFLLSAIGGRIWCSFGCPHTVYTEIFSWIEYRIEGNRSARMRLDKQPLSLEKAARKLAKHAAWIAVSLWTGITLVAYFTPVRTLLREIATLSLGPWQLFWMLFYSGLAYLNAGWMREQICQYLCAYARFQSVMFDRDTLLIAYDESRGEPRGVRRTWRAGAGPILGDCIDCKLCIQVCPAGIDIRDSLQYACIDCAACVDACDSVMDKIGAARGLIRYSAGNAMSDGAVAQQVRHLLRPRALGYLVFLVCGIAAYAAALASRAPVKLNVMLDRGAMGRPEEEGMVENVYRVQVMNTDEHSRRYRVEVTGIKGAHIVPEAEIAVEPISARAAALRVRVSKEAAEQGAHGIRLALQASDDPDVHVVEDAAFIVPK